MISHSDNGWMNKTITIDYLLCDEQLKEKEVCINDNPEDDIDDNNTLLSVWVKSMLKYSYLHFFTRHFN